MFGGSQGILHWKLKGQNEPAGHVPKPQYPASHDGSRSGPDPQAKATSPLSNICCSPWVHLRQPGGLGSARLSADLHSSLQRCGQVLAVVFEQPCSWLAGSLGLQPSPGALQLAPSGWLLQPFHTGSQFRGEVMEKQLVSLSIQH